jgi:hypothetical protein
MENKVIKLHKVIKLREKDRHITQAFCPVCHYWLFGEDVGSKYCPHCGIKLSWDKEKLDKYHEMLYNASIQMYEELI